MWMMLIIVIPACIFGVVLVITHRDILRFVERNPGAKVQTRTAIYSSSAQFKARTPSALDNRQVNDKLDKLLLLQRVDTAIKQLPKRERPHFRDQVLCITEDSSYQEMLRVMVPIAIALDARLKFHGLRRPDEIRQLTSRHSG
jgi:hypothetical protein